MSEHAEQRATAGTDAAAQATALYRRVLGGWNAHDAAAFAACFADDGHVVGFDGSTMDGRAEIESALRRIFTDHVTAAYIASVRDVRCLTPEVAVVRAAVGMVSPGGSDINPAVNALQTMVAVRREGEWRVALFQNTPAAFHGRPEAAEALAEELRSLL